MSNVQELETETASSVRERGLRIARENPMDLVLCGFAAGLVAGAVVPVTDRAP